MADEPTTEDLLADMSTERDMEQSYRMELSRSLRTIIATLRECGHTPQRCSSGDKYCPICSALRIVQVDVPEVFRK